MKLLVLQTLLLSALANMDGGYGANGMKSSDGKDNGRRGNGLALGQVSNGQMQEKKKDGMMYSDGQGRDMRLNGLALGQVSNGERQEEKKDGKNEEMRGNGLALGQVSNSQVQEEKKDGKDKDMGDDRMRMGKANGLNVLIDDEKKKQLGELATPDIVVIKQDWADGKGEVQMNPPAPGGNIITVIVGGGELIYTPDTVVAAVGDKINFVFMARNHTVTQSTFDKPCVKNPMGVDSGFMPNDGAMTPPPSMMFEVKTTAPTWFYCKQRTGTHCGKGMVFALNPTAEKTAGKFKEMALQQNGTAVVNGTTMPVDMAMSMTASIANAAGGTAPMTMTTVVATPTPAAASPDANNLVQGVGKMNDGGACDCTCMCGTAAFPPGAGVGNWGGYGGAMPAQWGSVPAAPAVKRT